MHVGQFVHIDRLHVLGAVDKFLRVLVLGRHHWQTKPETNRIDQVRLAYTQK